MLAALAVSAAMIAARGHVAPPAAQPQAQQAALGICLFQVPRTMHWVNLYALQRMNVRQRDGTPYRPLYETVLTFSRYDSIQIDIEPGAHIGIHSDAILKRLAECKEGS